MKGLRLPNHPQGTFAAESRLTVAVDKPVRKKGPDWAKLPAALAEPARPAEPVPDRARAYPSAGAILGSPMHRSIVDAAVRVAAGLGLVALGSQLAACAEPTCASSRFDELTVHGEQAYDSVVSYHDVHGAVTQLGYATGLTAHPPFHPSTMPGAMIMPLPILTGGGSEPDPEPKP
jgi:hypothetical protein